MRLLFLLLSSTLPAAPLPVCLAADGDTRSRFIDLSLVIAPDYPCTWPTFPPLLIVPRDTIGPLGPYNTDVVMLDGNTGTQLDVPPHSVTPSDSGLASSGRFGTAYTDRIEAWQFGGEACVIDCRDLLDAAPAGQSPLITRSRVIAWEKAHRGLGPGDVVIFRSGYSDAYYKPLPAGRRFAADPVEGRSPGWPDPDPDCMEYLASRGVMTLGTDSTSMGPLPLGEPTHFAGLKHGMTWTEGAIGLGSLPDTGAFYGMIGPKHAGGIYSEGRAFAIVGDPLARRLIDAARAHRAVDLSVTLADNLPTSWPGPGVGRHRQPYVTVRFGMNPNTRAPFEMHLMDSNAGTHLVPPSYALPPPGFDNRSYPAEVRPWLGEYESRFGALGTSEVTVEKVRIDQTCGSARIIDVRHLAGSTAKTSWPDSPEVKVSDIEAFEAKEGRLQPGEIAIFRTDWSDLHYRPLPQGEACLVEPLNGKREGWPAPGPDAIALLANRGIRCVATDAPSLGSVVPRRAAMTYWALGSKGMVGVEFLTGLAKLPRQSFFLFAAVNLKGAHGAPGRAIALY